jgi:hypothetical protein
VFALPFSSFSLLPLDAPGGKHQRVCSRLCSRVCREQGLVFRACWRLTLFSPRQSPSNSQLVTASGQAPSPPAGSTISTSSTATNAAFASSSLASSSANNSGAGSNSTIAAAAVLASGRRASSGGVGENSSLYPMEAGYLGEGVSPLSTFGYELSLHFAPSVSLHLPPF